MYYYFLPKTVNVLSNVFFGLIDVNVFLPLLWEAQAINWWIARGSCACWLCCEKCTSLIGVIYTFIYEPHSNIIVVTTIFSYPALVTPCHSLGNKMGYEGRIVRYLISGCEQLCTDSWFTHNCPPCNSPLVLLFRNTPCPRWYCTDRRKYCSWSPQSGTAVHCMRNG